MKFNQPYLILTVLMLCFHTGFAQMDAMPKPKPDSEPGCGCPQITRKPLVPAFYNPISSYINANTVNDITGWTLEGGKQTFDRLFYANGQGGGDAANWNGGLKVVAPGGPLRFTHPDKTFTLNVEACPNDYGIYVFEVYLYFKHPIKEDVKDFDFKKFDHTTFSYTHLLMQLARRRPDEMIRLTFKKLADRNGLEQMNEAIAKINEGYATGIPLLTQKNYQAPEAISGILDSLVSKKLRQERVFTTAFVLSEPGIHRVTSIEESRFYDIFTYYCSGLSNNFATFERDKLSPEYSAQIHATNIKIEISPNILSQQEKTPGNLPATVFAGVKSLELSSRDGLMADLINVCIPPTKIANTAVTIDFNQAKVLDAHRTNQYPEFDYKPYPQFISAQTGSDKNEMMYDTLLTNFSGLQIKEAYFTLRSTTGDLKFNGNNVLINNNLIAWCTTLDLALDNTQLVQINTGQGKKNIALKDLLTDLKTVGLTVAMQQTVNNHVLLYFKKTVR